MNYSWTKTKYIEMDFMGNTIYTFPLTVKDLITISYVAVRGRDKEEGAVQRVLNKKRISSIRQYVLDGNMFINSFILNWNDKNVKPEFDTDGIASIPLLNASAQLIDGQHRLEGIKEAASEQAEILKKEVLVSMTMSLSTKEAAKIFININSEQKPVPRSLIYDLYGVTEDGKNFAITRADDIAKIINEDPQSPYYNLIKYPGAPRGKGKIDLSTVVNGLKQYVDVSGKFPENNIQDLSLQAQIIMNYYSAIKYHWDDENLWVNQSQNVFFKASGFSAALEFFFETVFVYCVQKKSFKREYIISLFDFSDVSLITATDIKGSDGKTAKKEIMDNLRKGFKVDTPKEDEYEF